jgi:excinuclease UvrABC nuclease subunit
MASETSENLYILEVPEISSLPSLPLEERKALPAVGAVYFVCASTGAVLYVGSSKNLRQRWLLHHRQQQLAQTQGIRIAWQVVETTAHRLALEAHCLDVIRPLYQQSGMPLRRDKRGRVVYDVKLRLPEATYLRLSEAADDYHRPLPRQIVWMLGRIIRAGQLDKWSREPDDYSLKGASKRWNATPSPQLHLFS